MEFTVDVWAFWGTLLTVAGSILVAIVRGWFSTTTAKEKRNHADLQILLENLQDENARHRDDKEWLRRKLEITRERLGSVLAALARETDDTEALIAFLKDSALMRPLDQIDDPPEDR